MNAVANLYAEKLASYKASNFNPQLKKIHNEISEYIGQMIKRPAFADAVKAGITPPLWVKPVLRDRHIKGTTEHDKFTKQRDVAPSYFNDGINLQALIYLYAGTGKPIGNMLVGLPGSREVVELKIEIGYCINKNNKTPLPTHKFMIIYSGDNVHVVPASPNK